ncbi:Hypothetical predicted protein [Podarcis lilfordi]|uniref:Uncharacterized protein n=1 Tax=Podarcis lilfordi TaxID=74358 RepID=A0AA35P5G4_9SAUR|nr:Hypothetical predicted protein [Podarcis lilfordi]
MEATVSGISSFLTRILIKSMSSWKANYKLYNPPSGSLSSTRTTGKPNRINQPNLVNCQNGQHVETTMEMLFRARVQPVRALPWNPQTEFISALESEQTPRLALLHVNAWLRLRMPKALSPVT